MCDAPLDAPSLRSGPTQCPSCTRPFEATPFQPRELRHEAVQAVTQTPDGTAAACANHPGNAAVTSCQRCGLFICSLCDMNTGHGSYCPSCLERIRTGAVQTDANYRDYASMAVTAAIVGLFCTLVPVGALALYWGVKGVRQRRAEGVNAAGVIVAMVIGGLQTVGLVVAIVMIGIGVATKS